MKNNNLLHQAALTLKQGGVIIIPTETVYGIAADATNKSAVDKIFQIKQRDSNKPLQILLHNLKLTKNYVNFNEKSENLAKQYWPGPLTLILDEKEGIDISKNIHTDDKTLGVRVTKHEILDQLFELIDFPLAATSANISGEPAITNFKKANELFEGKVDYILDGGNCTLGEASSVIDARDENNIKILRDGAVKL